MVRAVSLSTADLITRSLTAELRLCDIRSLIIFSTPGWGHHIFSALPSHHILSTLALKLFRGEPAISGFDWNFSAIHTSSAAFSTEVGSALHWVLPQLQPGHG